MDKSDDVRELIDKYVITKGRLTEIENGLHDIIVTAARRYASVWTKHHRGYGYPISMDSLDWAISESGKWVNIEWEAWWSYGGHDESSFDFSIRLPLRRITIY